MKRTLVTVLATLAVVGMAFLAVGPKVQPMGAAVAIAAPAPVPMAVPIPERCPNIHAAIDALESARRDLAEARHDFCGHKREAMEAVTVAIRQLRQAEGCDRCR